MSTQHGKFATALECMDGRTQKAVSDFVKEKFQVDYVDAITEAGIDGKLGSETIDQNLFDSTKIKIEISVNGHGSRNIIIAGHDECAGNPVDYKTHKKHLLKTKERIKNLEVVLENGVEVISIFVSHKDGNWAAKEI
ncbi:MAG: hypothetical protein M1268_04840 [Patescibacteria group bacterium]|nr:hypothetical protein [Patescibacteria group bacterium]